MNNFPSSSRGNSHHFFLFKYQSRTSGKGVGLGLFPTENQKFLVCHFLTIFGLFLAVSCCIFECVDQNVSTSSVLFE